MESSFAGKETCPPPGPSLWCALALVIPLLRRHAVRIAFGFLCLIGVNLLQLSIPRLTKVAVDRLAEGRIDPAGLARITLLMMLFALGIAVCRFGWRYLIIGFSRIIERDIRTDLLRHLLLLDQPFFQKNTAGSIMALASNDLAAVQLAFGMGLVAAADALFMTMATLCFMAWINLRLTLLAILPMPLLAVGTLLLSRRIHHRFRRVQELFSDLTEFVRSSFGTIRLLQAYTQETAQSGHLDRLGRTYVIENIRLALVQGMLTPLSGLAGNLSLLVIVVFGGWLAVAGDITIGDFVAFMSYLFMLVWPMMAIGWVTNLMQRCLTSLHRLQAVFAQEPQLTEPAAAVPAAAPLTSVSLHGLTYSFPGREPTLRSIDLDLHRGITGLVGRTGSGKSVLCQLLVRLHPLPDGCLFFNGEDVNRLSLAGSRARIAYVPQESTLFAGTIRDNIAFAKPTAAMEEIQQAARMAMFHDDILAMPAGYDTVVGEKGVKLSGGQRQRIALARALLPDRDLIVIDDGLSAVDTQTEHAIIEQLLPYCRERVCVYASHRLAPLIQAYQTVVLEEGTVVARGTHDELLAGNAYYRAIHTHQTATAPVEEPGR
ncbi:MAG: ABC transporter ATP-binding protein [Thermodesulfobacteriota bacterium]